MSRGQRSSGPLLGRGPKLIGSLIGAGTEAYAHHKEKKAVQDDQAQTQQAIPTSIHRPASPGYPYNDDEMLDEEDWALDEASAELAGKEPHYSHAALSFAQVPMMPRSAMKPLPYPSHSSSTTAANEKPGLRTGVRPASRRMQRHR